MKIYNYEYSSLFMGFYTGVDGLVARVDYNTSAIPIVFHAGFARTIPVLIEVFDDEIDEADEEYFVIFLETNDSRVDLSHGLSASMCAIRDDESKI